MAWAGKHAPRVQETLIERIGTEGRSLLLDQRVKPEMMRLLEPIVLLLLIGLVAALVLWRNALCGWTLDSSMPVTSP